MNILRLFLLFSLAVLLGACSTTVHTYQTLAPQDARALKYAGVKIDSGVSNVPQRIEEHLRETVMARLAGLPQGTNPVEVDLRITNYQIVSQEERVFIGVLAGSNDMIVQVTVKDASGAVLEKFDVDRSTTHGTIDGALTDPGKELVEDAAEGIVSTLSGADAKHS